MSDVISSNSSHSSSSSSVMGFMSDKDLERGELGERATVGNDDGGIDAGDSADVGRGGGVVVENVGKGVEKTGREERVSEV